MGPAISARGLTKAYGSNTVLDGVDFDVAAGETVCMLGPNGAGKTTTVEMLLGLRRPDGGIVKVLNLDPHADGARLRPRIGVTLQESAFEPFLKTGELLELHAAYYAEPADPREVAARTGIADLWDRPARVLSGGQRRRLDIALSIVGQPEVVFLDEPSTGLDPEARRRMWRTIEGLKDAGTTILLTTHYLEEGEALADRIVVLHEHRVKAAGTADEIAALASKPTEISCTEVESLASAPLDFRPDRGRLVADSDDPAGDVDRLLAWARRDGVAIQRLAVRPPTVEDAYLELVG